MNNLILWLLFLILDLSLALFVYKIFGKNGLYIIIATSIIICNIQVTKIITMLGLVVTLGNVLYGSIFFATDILNEVYGKKSARRGVWLGFSALLIASILMQVSLFFEPHESDFADPHLKAIFSLMPRIAIASVTAYLLSQNHDVWAFEFWKKKTKGKHLWFRNNMSTLVSQAIDSLVFCVIAFWGVWPFAVWWQVLLTTYIFKFVVAIIDTPFIYMARRMSKEIVRREKRVGF